MRAVLRIERAGPLTTIQDCGRHGMLAHGISASGPMDMAAFGNAGLLAGGQGAGIEITRAGLDFIVADGQVSAGWSGGAFDVKINGRAAEWPGAAHLMGADRVSITPGAAGNYGYVRFGGSLELEPVLSSRSTSIRARLGGFDGRMLEAGDELVLNGTGVPGQQLAQMVVQDGPIRFIRGLHWDRFSASVQDRFVTARFQVSSMMDRMGVRLEDKEQVFAGESILSLVSDPVLPGDIQILGDGKPIALMRDHQPTGGYPRIGTIITADLDRFAQMRPGTMVAFQPVSVEHAHRLLRSRA